MLGSDQVTINMNYGAGVVLLAASEILKFREVQ